MDTKLLNYFSVQLSIFHQILLVTGANAFNMEPVKKYNYVNILGIISCYLIDLEHMLVFWYTTFVT